MKKYILMFMILGMFILIGNVSAIAVGTCGLNLNVSGTYTLSSSINGTGSCLTISGGDITLDCQGNRIVYGERGAANTKGIIAYNSTNNKTNITIQNCVIIMSNNSNAGHYGIQIQNVTTGLIINNTILTNGTSTNYPIFISQSSNITVTENNLIAKGSTSSNIGVFININNMFLNITNNNVTTLGTTTNHAIQTGVNLSYSSIVNNNLYTNGIGVTNDGILMGANTTYNIIDYNNITINGSQTHYGIYVLGTDGGIAHNNTFRNNNIFTISNVSGANYGMRFQNNIMDSNISNNTILTYGISANVGIQIDGAALTPTRRNFIDYNNITLNNSDINSINIYGLVIGASSYDNVANYNNVWMGGGRVMNGIYVLSAATTQSYNNSINYNNVSVISSNSTAYGIYLTNSLYTSNITNNLILVNCTTVCYGIHALGVADATQPTMAYNNFLNNNITVYGLATSYAMVFSTNAQYNNIQNNRIYVNSTNTGLGLYLVGAASGNSDFNTIENNTMDVYSNNRTSLFYGMLLQNGVNENLVTNNFIRTTGGTGVSYGFTLLSSASLDASFNVISNNYINATGNGPAASIYGMQIYTNTNENYVNNNLVNIWSNISSYSLYLHGDGYPVLKNDFNNNIFNNYYAYSTNATASGTGLMAAFLNTNANENVFYNNTFNVTGRTTSYGLYISVSSDNIFINNSIFSIHNQSFENTSEGIYLNGKSKTNTFENNYIKATGNGISFITSGYRPEDNIFKNNSLDGISRNDVYFRSPFISGNQFINQPINQINFTGKGVNNTLFEDTRYGYINFIDYINKTTGILNETYSNLSKVLILANNYAYTNSSQTTGYFLNTSAIVKLYNIPSYSNPAVYVNGLECSATMCSGLTDEGSGVFSFRVNSWSYYQILNKPATFTYNCTIINVTAFLTTASICDTLNKTRNSLLASPVYTGFAQTNASASCDMGINITILTGDMTCDLLRQSRATLEDVLNVTYSTTNFTYTSGLTNSFGMATSYRYD